MLYIKIKKLLENCNFKVFIVFLTALLLPGTTHAQCNKNSAIQGVHWQVAPVKIYRSQSTLSDALKEFAQQTECSVLVDGWSSRQVPELNIEASAEQALDRICNLFDYKWRLSKGGVILLEKRFAEADTRPQAQKEELQEIASYILQVLQTANGTVPNSLAVSDDFLVLARSLTPTQVQALFAGQSLPVATLPPASCNLATQIIRNDLYSGAWNAWENLSVCLRTYNKSRLTYRKYILKLKNNDTKLSEQFCIESGDRFPPTRSQGYDLHMEADNENNKPEQKSLLPSPSQMSLEQFTTLLSDASGVRVISASAIRKRELTVQLQKVSLPVVLDALADLEGFTWFRTKTGTIRIERSRPEFKEKTPASVATAITSILPPDVRTLLAIGPQAEMRTRPGSRSDEGLKHSQYREQAHKDISRMRLAEEPELFMLLKEKLLAQGTVPVHTLTKTQQHKLTLILLLNTLDQLDFRPLYGVVTTYEADPMQANLALKRSGAIELQADTAINNKPYITTLGCVLFPEMQTARNLEEMWAVWQKVLR